MVRNEGEIPGTGCKASVCEKLGKEVVFVSDYHVTGEAATKAVSQDERWRCSPFFRIHVSVVLRRPRMVKSSAKSWLTWLISMYAMHLVLLTEHMLLLQVLPNLSAQKADRM